MSSTTDSNASNLEFSDSGTSVSNLDDNTSSIRSDLSLRDQAAASIANALALQQQQKIVAEAEAEAKEIAMRLQNQINYQSNQEMNTEKNSISETEESGTEESGTQESGKQPTLLLKDYLANNYRPVMLQIKPEAEIFDLLVKTGFFQRNQAIIIALIIFFVFLILYFIFRSSQK